MQRSPALWLVPVWAILRERARRLHLHLRLQLQLQLQLHLHLHLPRARCLLRLMRRLWVTAQPLLPPPLPRRCREKLSA